MKGPTGLHTVSFPPSELNLCSLLKARQLTLTPTAPHIYMYNTATRTLKHLFRDCGGFRDYKSVGRKKHCSLFNFLGKAELGFKLGNISVHIPPYSCPFS